MQLPTRAFGRTGMEITRVGLGAWAIGGGEAAFGWGDQDDADSIATIHQAVVSGLNWIDTAAVYGRGHSEEVVGRALATLPETDRPFVFTKCGLPYAEGASRPDRVGAPDSLRRDLEGSLRRLGVERIDLLQMHWPAEDGTPLEETWQTLLDFVTEGKVRAVGVSNFSVAELETCEAVGHVGTLQPPLSAINRGAAAELVPWCHAHETGVIVYSPMQAGLLTGRFTKERAAALPENDWRGSNARFRGAALDANLALADALGAVAERRGTSTAAVAVAWTLAWPGVSGAIVGARTPDQIDGWLDAARLELDAADLDEIAAAIASTGAGEGPERPGAVVQAG